MGIGLGIGITKSNDRYHVNYPRGEELTAVFVDLLVLWCFMTEFFEHIYMGAH